MDEERITPEEIIQEIPAAYQHPDLWIYQLDSSDIIAGLEHILRSEFWNRKDNVWEKKGNPWMNEIGIGVILGVVSSHLTKEKILTDVPKPQINRMCREIGEDVVENLMQDWEKYGIDQSKLTLIIDVVDHYIYMNLSRSSEGRTLEYFKPTIKRTEIVKPAKEERSVFGFLPFFKG